MIRFPYKAAQSKLISPLLHFSVLHPFLISLSPWCSNLCMCALNRFVRNKMSCDVIFHTSDHFLVCLWHIPNFECLALYASSIFFGSLCSSLGHDWWCVHMFVYEEEIGKYSHDICSATFLLVCVFFVLPITQVYYYLE